MFHNINQVISDIRGKEAQIKLVVAKALNKTTLWLKSQAAKEISEEKRIKSMLVRTCS
ncbi:hypothetical protein [Wolbachia endosymbiont (group B) of Ischnura elegans]|uniref:hypothetical protein n=1 Tax=Wolbachia endosymbiont (group B) of Ischnura elegans TaxID=2954021 RepID=UPI002230E214|nr:hypothetical protein [Wolbachia endosymbiont (group B) of Ischnura elegans]